MSDNSKQQSNTGTIVVGSILSALSFAAFACIIVGSILMATLSDTILLPIILIIVGFALFVIFGFFAYHFWDVLAAQKVRGAKAMKICSIVQHFLLYYFLYMMGAIIGGIISVACTLFGKEPPKKKNAENENETTIRDELGHQITIRKTTLQERYDGDWYQCWTDTMNNVYLTKDGKKFVKKP